MHLITAPLPTVDSSLPAIPIQVDCRTLLKRLWRGAAVDGTEFGFQLEAPLNDGSTVWASANARYVIQQLPEAVLEISLLSLTAENMAITGWAIGNLHFPIETQPGRILAPDDPAVRQALTRMGVDFTPGMAVFRPHRLAVQGHTH